jgi:hypothetical protein
VQRLGDWTAAGNGGGGWLVAVDLLVIRGILIFVNGRQVLVVIFFHLENDTVLHSILRFLVCTILCTKMWDFFHTSPTQHPTIPHTKILAEVLGYLHLHTVGFNTK